MNHSNLFNFFKSSTLGCSSFVHMNDIAEAQSGSPLCKIYSSLMTTECKMLNLFPCSYLTFNTVNNHISVGEVIIWERYSLRSCTTYDMYYFILISTLLLFRYIILIYKNVCTLPFVDANPGNLSSVLLMKSSTY